MNRRLYSGTHDWCCVRSFMSGGKTCEFTCTTVAREMAKPASEPAASLHSAASESPARARKEIG